MRLHAVVVNYKTYADLRKFLLSWEQHTPLHHKWNLTVVNVAPNDLDCNIGEEWAGEQIEHQVFESNIGYARACNAAACTAATDTDVYAFFNADVSFRDDALDRILSAIEDNPGWGVVGPRQVDSKRKLTHAGIFGTHAAPQHRGWHHRDNGKYDDIVPAITVSGAAYFIRSSLWNELTDCETYQAAVADLGIGPAVGAFLPTRHYYEETWCSYHAAAHGWPVIYYGQATVVHEWHQASPLGGHADKEMRHSQVKFRAACDAHGIERD